MTIYNNHRAKNLFTGKLLTVRGNILTMLTVPLFELNTEYNKKYFSSRPLFSCDFVILIFILAVN